MVGASIFCALCLPVSATFLTGGAGLDLVPTWVEAGWLLVLACTVYAYAEYVELLKRLPVFTINLAYKPGTALRDALGGGCLRRTFGIGRPFLCRGGRNSRSGGGAPASGAEGESSLLDLRTVRRCGIRGPPRRARERNSRTAKPT